MKDLNLDIFRIKHNNKIPQKGSILISEPFSKDMYFKRSVVLLTEHNKEGSVGFILNKPVDYSLNELLVDFPSFNAPVTLGGPVKTDSIHFIHTLGETIPGSINVTKDIWWGGNFDALKDLVNTEMILPSQIRFFVGYSGWHPNQLENEIKSDFWLISDLPSDIIMNAEHDIWKDSLSKMGDKYQLWSGFPENPKMN